MKKRKVYVWTMRFLMWLAAGITAALTVFLLGYVLIRGLPNISWELLSTKPSYLRGTVGILPDILNTLYMILATLLFVLPLGVGAAVYLTEYATNIQIVKVGKLIEFDIGNEHFKLDLIRQRPPKAKG